MEKTLNIMIGVILMSNLYYLSPIIGISNSTVIIFSLTTSFLGFLFRFKTSNFKFLGTKLTLRIIFLSFFFFVINSASSYEIHLNDIFRISGYTFYFCWTISIFENSKALLKNHFRRLLTALFLVIIVMLVFEYYFFEIFRLIINDEFILYDGNGRRLAVTFIDPNSFAFAIISFAYVLIRLEKSTLKVIFILMTTLLIINFTGSRLGLLLALFLFYPLILKFIKVLNFSKTIILFTMLPALYFVPISQNEDSKIASVLERVFDEEKSKSASTSNNLRIESLKAAFIASDLNNILIPPGNIFFKSKWDKVINARHYPHSTFLYLFVEYGIYFIWPLFIILTLYNKAKHSKILGLYCILILGLSLLPNIIYYSTTFFIIYYIEHEYSSYTSVIKKQGPCPSS